MSMLDGEICPVCGQGRIYRRRKQETFEYKGKKLTFDDYPVHECDTCGEGFVAAEDAKGFDKQVTDFHSEIDGFPESDKIRKIHMLQTW